MYSKKMSQRAASMSACWKSAMLPLYLHNLKRKSLWDPAGDRQQWNCCILTKHTDRLQSHQSVLGEIPSKLTLIELCSPEAWGCVLGQSVTELPRQLQQELGLWGVLEPAWPSTLPWLPWEEHVTLGKQQGPRVISRPESPP